MNDVAVALEHIDLLDGLDGLDVQLLKRSLELLVVGAGALVDLLDLPAGCTLAAITVLALIMMPSISSSAHSSHVQCVPRGIV